VKLINSSKYRLLYLPLLILNILSLNFVIVAIFGLHYRLLLYTCTRARALP